MKCTHNKNFTVPDDGKLLSHEKGIIAETIDPTGQYQARFRRILGHIQFERHSAPVMMF